jgi:hypothetical protein
MKNKAIGSPHENHLIKLVATDRTNYKTNIHSNNHMSKYYCITCDKSINFASKDEWNYWNQQMYQVLTYKDFVDDFMNSGHMKPKQYNPTSVIPNEAFIVYLECPYSKKDIAKNLGANWDPNKKKWMITSYNTNWQRLLPWIHPDDEKKLRDAHSKPIPKTISTEHLGDGESHNMGLFRLQDLLNKTKGIK